MGANDRQPTESGMPTVASTKEMEALELGYHDPWDFLSGILCTTILLVSVLRTKPGLLVTKTQIGEE